MPHPSIRLLKVMRLQGLVSFSHLSRVRLGHARRAANASRVIANSFIASRKKSYCVVIYFARFNWA